MIWDPAFPEEAGAIFRIHEVGVFIRPCLRLYAGNGLSFDHPLATQQGASTPISVIPENGLAFIWYPAPFSIDLSAFRFA